MEECNFQSRWCMVVCLLALLVHNELSCLHGIIYLEINDQINSNRELMMSLIAYNLNYWGAVKGIHFLLREII